MLVKCPVQACLGALIITKGCWWLRRRCPGQSGCNALKQGRCPGLCFPRGLDMKLPTCLKQLEFFRTCLTHFQHCIQWRRLPVSLAKSLLIKALLITSTQHTVSIWGCPRDVGMEEAWNQLSRGHGQWRNNASGNWGRWEAELHLGPHPRGSCSRRCLGAGVQKAFTIVFKGRWPSTYSA